MTIWKFPLEVTDDQTLSMPFPAKPLSVQVQNGTPFLWALIGQDEPLVRVRVLTHGTGNPITLDQTLADYVGEFLGTYQLHGGMLVFHVFTHREGT